MPAIPVVYQEAREVFVQLYKAVLFLRTRIECDIELPSSNRHAHKGGGSLRVTVRTITHQAFSTVLSLTNSTMGSSHSKPGRVKPGRYQQIPQRNTWLAADSFGYPVHFDEFMFKAQHFNRCYLCSRNLTVTDEIVYHNTERCQAAVHAQCMRKWLLRFIDARGRHSRPQCLKCHCTLNIRQVKRGRTKDNPLGDFRPF